MPKDSSESEEECEIIEFRPEHGALEKYREPEEIPTLKVSGTHHFESCEGCSVRVEHAQEIVQTNAEVLRHAGYTIAYFPHMYFILTFLDSAINHHPWQPDERVIFAVLAAYGLFAAYCWKVKSE